MSDAEFIDDLPEPMFRPTLGAYVSGVAHVGLLTWLIMGWGLNQEPLPFDSVDVSVVSSEEFAAMFNSGQPDIEQEDVPVLSAPEVETVPEVTPEEPVTPVEPDPVPEAPAEETQPTAVEPVPAPAQVEDVTPELETPALPTPPNAPDLPVTQDTPQVQEAPRVAPQAALAPPLDADIAPEVQQEATPEAESAEVVEDAAEATAPEEATTEIVTEAEEPSGAVISSPRPQSRPTRLVPEVPRTPAETAVADSATAADQPETEDNTLDSLLTELTTDQPTQDVAGDPGPPITGGERDAFGLSIEGCWIVDPGSEAAQVTVTVAFSLNRDRKVVGNSVELLSSQGGSDAAANAAFEVARRALLRCQNRGDGFTLPAEKFEQWRNVEVTFDPSEMRIR